MKKELNDLDVKFSKAIAEILCSIGELRQSVLKNAAEYSKLWEQMNEMGIDHGGYLNGHDMKLQSLEAQVKRLFASKEEKLGKNIRTSIFIDTIKNAITEYNRG